jgi:uncharacterized protein YndB with AHSA1/START domain
MSAIADVDRGTVKADVEIAAPPEAVFRALTDPTELAAWWGSDDAYRTHAWRVDLRVGGRWSCEAVNAKDGHLSQVRGEYLEVDPPRRLVLTWEPSWERFARTTIRYDLSPTTAGTRLVVTHSGFTTAASAEGHAEGWNRVLGWLGRRFAGGST